MVLKRFFFLGLSLVLSISIVGFLFITKVTRGINIYNHEPVRVPTKLDKKNILVFSKTNAFRHGESINAFNRIIKRWGSLYNWNVIFSSSGGVFIEGQIDEFDLIIWNNVTGKVLNQEQRNVFKSYMLNGGGFIGLHGSGDGSHDWPWYQDSLIGAEFSHHGMHPQVQLGKIVKECHTSQFKCKNLLDSISIEDEWYVFLNNPRDNATHILYTLTSHNLNHNGNIPFLVKNKNWDMGEDHPVIWTRNVGGGRMFYSALGHHAISYQSSPYLDILLKGIQWAGSFTTLDTVIYK